MTEMRGFMERVAQVVARQEHELDNGLPRVLGVLEGRLAQQEGTTQHLTEATVRLITHLDEQDQRIVELVPSHGICEMYWQIRWQIGNSNSPPMVSSCRLFETSMKGCTRSHKN